MVFQKHPINNSFPQHLPEHEKNIEESILRIGFTNPIIYCQKQNNKTLVIDGHLRLSIAKKHNITDKLDIRYAKNEEQARDIALSNNFLDRGELTTSQKAMIAVQIYYYGQNEELKNVKGRKIVALAKKVNISKGYLGYAVQLYKYSKNPENTNNAKTIIDYVMKGDLRLDKARSFIPTDKPTKKTVSIDPYKKNKNNRIKKGLDNWNSKDFENFGRDIIERIISNEIDIHWLSTFASFNHTQRSRIKFCKKIKDETPVNCVFVLPKNGL